MRIVLKSLLYLKILLIGCAVCMQSTPANAAPGIPGDPADIYVNIDKSTLHLKQLFKLIEKQTTFSFAYDETDIIFQHSCSLSKGHKF